MTCIACVNEKLWEDEILRLISSPHSIIDRADVVKQAGTYGIHGDCIVLPPVVIVKVISSGPPGFWFAGTMIAIFSDSLLDKLKTVKLI